MEQRRFWSIVAILFVFFVLLVMLGNCSALDDCPSPPLSGNRDYTLLSIVDQVDLSNSEFRVVLTTVFRVRGPEVKFEPYDHTLPIVGQEWWLGGQLIKTCGDTERRFGVTIFYDGFESGDTSAWSGATPG